MTMGQIPAKLSRYSKQLMCSYLPQKVKVAKVLLFSKKNKVIAEDQLAMKMLEETITLKFASQEMSITHLKEAVRSEVLIHAPLVEVHLGTETLCEDDLEWTIEGMTQVF
jgi:hypothetical protein